MPVPRPAPVRSDSDLLRAIVIAAGIGWSVLFVVVGLRYELQLYGDGAMFSYAVAVQDVWAFHWHNISGRLTPYLLSLAPAEAFVALTGNAGGGIVVYGLLFFAMPLLGLLATFAADRSPASHRSSLSPVARRPRCVRWCSAFRPKCGWRMRYSGRRSRSLTMPAAGWAALPWCSQRCSRSIFTHEGAFVLAGAIVATLALRGMRDACVLASGRCPGCRNGDLGGGEGDLSAGTLLRRRLCQGRAGLLRYRHFARQHDHAAWSAPSPATALPISFWRGSRRREPRSPRPSSSPWRSLCTGCGSTMRCMPATGITCARCW